MDAARPGGGDAVGGAGNTRVARRESGEDATGRGGPERDAARAARGRGVSRLTRYTKSDPEARSDRTSQMQSVLSGHGSTFFMIMLCGVQNPERKNHGAFFHTQSIDRRLSPSNHEQSQSHDKLPSQSGHMPALTPRESTSHIDRRPSRQTNRNTAACCGLCRVPLCPTSSRRLSSTRPTGSARSIGMGPHTPLPPSPSL